MMEEADGLQVLADALEKRCEQISAYLDIEANDQRFEQHEQHGELAFWIQARDKLRNRLRDVSIENLKSSESVEAQLTSKTDSNDQYLDSVEPRLTELQEKSLEDVVRGGIAQLHVNRIQETAVIGSLMTTPDHELSPERKRLRDILVLREQRTLELNQIQSELRDTRDRLASLRQDSADAVEFCRHHYSTFADSGAPPGDQEGADQDAALKRLLNNLRAQRLRYRIVRGVFQGLVAGSKVNWAKDPDLKKLMLSQESLEF